MKRKLMAVTTTLAFLGAALFGTVATADPEDGATNDGDILDIDSDDSMSEGEILDID